MSSQCAPCRWWLAPTLALAAGCGDADAPTTWTLRVLASRAPAADEQVTIFADEMRTLDGWLALTWGPDAPLELAPAPSCVRDGRLVLKDGHVVLPPGTALLRRVDLQQATEHAFTARLRGPTAKVGERCPNLCLLKTTARPGLDPFGGPLASEQLLLLAQVLSDGAAASRAVWREPAGDGAFAQARWLAWLDPEGTPDPSRMLVIAAQDAPLEVDRVQLAVTPQLHPGSDESTAFARPRDSIVIERVKLGGDGRLSAIVPPGQVLRVPLDVPERATTLTLGACPDLEPVEHRTSGVTRWSVRLQPGGQTIHELVEDVSSDCPPRFTDYVLRWPEGVHGALTLELSVEGAAAMIFGQPIVRGPEPPRAPSLLLVSIDTLRADHVGFLGYDRPTTPFLDELARRGVVFTDVTAVSSYTLPTHASLLTGLFPPRHLALDSSDRLNTRRTPTLAMRLSEAGFETAAFTGGGFLSGDYGFSDGFDRYSTVDPMSAAGPGLAAAEAWIDAQGRRSWFAFVHTYDAHDYTPPAEDLALFERAPADPGFDLIDLIDGRDLRATPPTPAELDRLTDLYDASIHHVDRSLRAFIESLRARGRLDDTWIVVTSDHGEEFFEHGGLRHRDTLYQELTRVPLLIVPPDGGAGLRVDEPVSQADVLPTLIELMQQPVPDDLDGRSLAAAARGGPLSGAPTPLYSQIERSTSARAALRSGVWKLVRTDTPDPSNAPSAERWELFDLEHDPDERHDVALEDAAELDQLRVRLEAAESALHLRAGPRTRFEPDDELRQRLNALGYVTGER